MGRYIFGTLAFMATAMTVPAQAGSVYVVNSAVSADLNVYVANASISADLDVYYVDVPMLAKGKDGVWCLVDSGILADVNVYFVHSPVEADLTIFVVDAEILAGWNNKDHPWVGKLH